MIERIIIENFKSIRRLELDLKPLNILIGANGVGKSNFLSFFKLTNRIYEQRLQELIRNNIDSFLYFGRKKSKYFAGLFDFNNNIAFRFAITSKSQSNQGYIDFSRLQLNENDDNKKDYYAWRTLFIESNEEESKIREHKHSHSKAVNEYLNSFKVYQFQDTGWNSLLKGKSQINNNRFLREHGSNLAAYLYYIQEKHPGDFKNIELQIRSVAPFFLRFELQPDRLNEDEIELLWVEKGISDYFNAYRFSDGTLRFIALTTLLLQPDLPKTIIIDEPELGLHPFAINKLAAMMKAAAAKGSQIIVSTQSVDLVDNFEPEDVIAVDRKDNESTFKRLESEELKEWLEDYTLGALWVKNLVGAMP